MNRFSALLVVLVLVGLTVPASAAPMFDIYDDGGFEGADDDGLVGFIAFTEGGLITDVTKVSDFQYTTETGTSYTEANITGIQVFVDATLKNVCWAADSTVTACDSNLYPTVLDEVGLTLDDGFLFTSGTPTMNWAIAHLSGPLDRFIRFEPHVAAAPEPATLALMGLGLAGIGFMRKKAHH